jgi:sugar phosphate permease
LTTFFRKWKSEGYRYIICLLIFLGYMLVFFHRLCPAVIALDMQEAFGASGTLLGVLGSAYFYPYAIMQLPTGLLADSWGPRKTVSAFFLLAASGSVLMGMAPNLAMGILGRILVGVGVSTVFVCNFKLLAEWFNPKQFVIMGGIFMATGGVGALFSSAPLGWVSNLIGWRMTLVAVGVTTLMIAILVYAFVRNRPSDMGLPSMDTSTAGGPEREGSLLGGIKLVVGSGRFWPLAVWTFFVIGIAFAFAGLWGGPYLIQVYGLSKTSAGGVLSMFAVALIVGSPFLSWIANHIGRKPIFIGCSLLLTAVCGVFYAFTDRLTLPGLYMMFFFFSLAGAATGPVVAAISKELFPVSIAGTSVGTVNVFPFFGGALFQVVVGAILTRGGHDGWEYLVAGYQDMFLIYLVGALISLLAAAFLRETLSKESRPRAGNSLPSI